MIKQAIKKIFYLFGFDIRGINRWRNVLFAPLRNTMEESLGHILSLNFKPDVIIDVGAATGTRPLLNIFPNARYLWIEPLNEFENDLKKLTQRFKGDYLIATAGKSNGTVKINVYPFLEGSSTLRLADEVMAAEGAEREVKTVRLDDLIDKFTLKDNMLLKIDVQGAELDVLEGAQKLINNCEVIILEVSFFKFHENQPELYDVVRYMKTKNFVAYDIVDGHNRPLDNALAQKDIIFVKESSFFRRTHKWVADEQKLEILNAMKEQDKHKH